MELFIALVFTIFGSGYSLQKNYDECKQENFKEKKCEFAKLTNKLGAKK